MHPWTDFHAGLSLIIGVVGFAALVLIAFDRWVESGRVKNKFAELTKTIVSQAQENKRLRRRIAELEGN